MRTSMPARKRTLKIRPIAYALTHKHYVRNAYEPRYAIWVIKHINSHAQQARKRTLRTHPSAHATTLTQTLRVQLAWRRRLHARCHELTFNWIKPKRRA